MEYIMNLCMVERKVETEIGWEETNKKQQKIYFKKTFNDT